MQQPGLEPISILDASATAAQDEPDIHPLSFILEAWHNEIIAKVETSCSCQSNMTKGEKRGETGVTTVLFTR